MSLTQKDLQKEQDYLKLVQKLVNEKIKNDDTLQTEALVELRKKYNMKINDNDIKKSYNEATKEALAKNTNENSSN